MEPPTLSLSSSGVPAANQSFARRYKYVWPFLLTVNLGIGGLPFESYSYGQGPIVNWLRLGCLETLRSCDLSVNESIELKHEVEALRGQLAAANTYAERCKTSTLQAKEAYLAIRAEVEELERKMDDLQEERERRTSGELEG
ncbi:hypothetical protein IFM89_033443 [Coptis chinensis]|uniref:Uncharacterized protein n=1 Tax=Coptis chinensis TaxID=261450 RepID=A0A835HYT2_9MAGN|nr:hypothetical protein IFM89_033443 [Coptis chinensis]